MYISLSIHYIYNMGKHFFVQSTLLPKSVVERLFEDLAVLLALFDQIDTGNVWEARRAASNELG